jgi:hypothetical protein
MIRNATYNEVVKAISDIGGYISDETSRASMTDRSIVVEWDNNVAAVIPVFINEGLACHMDGTSIIPYYNEPLVVDDVLSMITDWLCGLLKSGDARAIKILPGDRMLRLLQSYPFLAIEDNTRLYGYYDLTTKRSNAWGSIRRRYKSRINSGARELQRTVYGQEAHVGQDVIDFLLGGKEILGYDLTNSAVEEYLARIENGSARLFVYRNKEQLAGVVGIGEWKKFAAQGHYFYDIGAYNQRISLPLHYCLYDAINYHRDDENSLRVYLLHGVPIQRPDNESKLSNIDFFKRGFCTHFFIRDYKVLSLA